MADYLDVLAAPPDMVTELVAGRLHLSPRPAARHVLAQSRLGARINLGFQSPEGGWWIIDEPELHLGDDVLVPDIAGWQRTTLPVYPDAAFFTTVPDWVCEVLSPGTRKFDLSAKRDIYGRAGVGFLWLLDPDSRTLEGFCRQTAGWCLVATFADDDAVILPPFNALRFSLSDLWPDQLSDERPE